MRFLGSEHNTLLDWLGTRWIESGPPVCLVTGFPGVGKTRLSHELLDRLAKQLPVRFPDGAAVDLELPESSRNGPDDFLWRVADELARLGRGELQTRLQQGEATDRASALAITELLTQPLVILDEWQRCLDEQGEPHRFFVELFRRFTNSRVSRLLALANRQTGDTTVIEGIDTKSLSGLTADDGGVQLLVEALGTRSDAIPDERRGDVVQWMQGNPRALEMVAAALRSATLDDLIGLAPEVWETRDREVDPGLLTRLHEQIVTKVVAGLPDDAAEFLRSLSVHRQPFDNEALKALQPNVARRLACQRTLVERLLLQLRKNWFHVQELAAEVIRRQLSEDRAAFESAHLAAGKYHSRHFTAKQVVIVPGMGEHFLEARYHFTQARNDAELANVVEPFRAHLRNQCGFDKQLPKDAGERGERIATLLALLSEGGTGDEALNFHLARCLTARRAPGDRRRALDQLQRTKLYHKDPWIMRLHLEAELELCEVLRTSAADALMRLPAVAEIYVAAAEGLAKHNQLQEAIELLKDGIKVVPPDKNLMTLYTLAAELLARDGKLSEAIQLLKAGIKVVPIDTGKGDLFVKAAELLARDGELLECWDVFREALRLIPVGPFYRLKLEAAYIRNRVKAGDVAELQRSIAVAGEECLSEWGQRFGESFCLAFDNQCHDAADTLIPDRQKVTSRMLEAFWRVMAGEADIAAELVFASHIVQYRRNAWLMCLVELRRGRATEAQGHFQRLIPPAADGTRIVSEEACDPQPDGSVTERDLLRVWNGPVLGYEHPAILFPLLPPALTGLPHAVCRPVDRSPSPEIAKLLEPVPIPVPSRLKAVFRRNGEHWDVAWIGSEPKSIDAVNGMTYLYGLLQQPDRPIRVDVLLQEPLPDNEFVRHTKVDGKALKKMKEHLKFLDKQLAEHEASRSVEQDLPLDEREERAEQLQNMQAKRDELASHLASVTGPDGKPKREGTAADKQSARVREAIKSALQKLKEYSPEVAEHLDHCQSSDAFQFCYRPDRIVEWEL